MPDSQRRGIIGDIRKARTGLARRIRILIRETSPAVAVAPANPYANEAPDNSTDFVQPATGTFTILKSENIMDEFGKQTARKGKIECHTMYEMFFRRAYACQISGEVGRWAIRGVSHDTARMTVAVLVEDMG